MEMINAKDMVVEVVTDDGSAVMFQPVGENIAVPTYMAYGKEVLMLLSKDHNGRACYKRLNQAEVYSQIKSQSLN